MASRGCWRASCFRSGLVLVVVGGAELFTGNTLIVMAWASGKVRTRQLLGNWTLAFAGNCLGATSTAALMFYTGQYAFGGGAVGLNALAIAQGKVSLGFVQAFALGLMCNTLVCLAVWMCYSARTTRGPHPDNRPADLGLRCGGLRAQHRERLLRARRPVHQGGRAGLFLDEHRQVVHRLSKP